MELRPGCKQTEVGVIPEEWALKSLGSLSSLVASGRSSSKAKIGDFPVHGSTGVIGYTATPEYEGAALLVARVGANAGRLNVVSGRYGVTDNTIMLRLTAACDLAFVSLQLEAKRLNSLVFGSGQPLITGTQLKALPLALPSLFEQHAIASALSDVDALLGGLDRLIAKKRDLKQAAMQQLLTGQTRLPGFHAAWEEKRLGEIGDFLKGRGVKKDEAKSGELPCIRYGELYTHHDDYVRSFYSWISRDVAGTATPIRRGDVLFAGSGETKEEIGKCVAFVDDLEAYAGGDIVILRPTEVNALFLGYLLNTPAVASQKASRGQGDAVVHISAGALASIRLSLPSLNEQAAIAAVLSDMDTDLLALEARRDKTLALKQGMMQELLTGRTRLL